MRRQTTLIVCGILALGIYRYRRSLLARLLNLPPPRHTVGVQRAIPIVMPDGVRLLADHYFPKVSGEFPTILIRTPYGRGKEVALWGGYPLSELPAQLLAERGYHVIVQGARGCFDSEGEFSPHIHEAVDGQATVAWITQQAWFSGVLGSWGPSYLGYTQWAMAAKPHAALKAMVPIAASSENFTVTHPDGAFGLETRLRWSQGLFTLHQMHRWPLKAQLIQRLSARAESSLQAAFLHLPLLEADRSAAGEPIPFYRHILTHHEPDEPFWTARDHSRAVSQVSAPVHLIGGWYDYYLRGLLRDYATLKAAGHQPYLTIGPWFHAEPAMLTTGLREGLAWFDAHLQGDRSRLRFKPVRIYVMGANQWRELEDFPPPTRETRFYLQDGGLLTREQPPLISSSARYRYDPADPTPALGGALLAARGAGAQDNRTLEARSDVLCYTTPPMTDEIEVIGPVRLELHVHSNRSHTDFFGRLCDVAPDGCSTNVCDGLLRVEPGQVNRLPNGNLLVHVDMWATAHRFRRGHRLRLLVSSGAHPRWSRNLGTGEAVASGTGMAVAQQTVYHGPGQPSALVLPIAP